MDVPRWTIAELLTRYELEPTLTDSFVEGQFDKDIIMCAYEHSAGERRAMYTADVVDVDNDQFAKHGLTKGNKQKLLILCRELSSVNESEKIRFIVDRDTDHWFGELESGKGLLWTEYCDIETYFFEEKFVKELVEGAGKAKVPSWEEFYDSFRLTLKALFSVRAAARGLDLKLDYMDFAKFLSIEGGAIVFDRETYIVRTLLKSSASTRLKEMLASSGEWCDRFDGDARLFCRGHDFVILIAWAILKYKGSKALTDEVVGRVLVLLVPRDISRFSSLM